MYAKISQYEHGEAENLTMRFIIWSYDMLESRKGHLVFEMKQYHVVVYWIIDIHHPAIPNH